MFILLALSVTAAPFNLFGLFGENSGQQQDNTNTCAASDITTTALFPLKGLVAPNDISFDQEIQDLNRVSGMQTVDVKTTAFGSDITNPSWLTVFAMHSGTAYCDTTDTTVLSKFGQPIPQMTGGLPMGNILVDSIHEFDQYSGLIGQVMDVFHTKKDGKFVISVSNDQKLIVLSWRGTKSFQDFAADFDGQQLDLSSPSLSPFLDSSPTTNPNCKVPTDTTDMFMFAGFAKVMQNSVMTDHVIPKLRDVQTRFPGYSVVINGHSLGAAKSFLTAFYLSKFYNDINLKAVYSFEQPLIGSTKLASWMAGCIGEDKIVRVVSSNDIVPWMRFAPNIQHPPSVKEVFNVDSSTNQYQVCQGSLDPNCSAKYSCGQRNWDNHSQIGGVKLGGLCQYIGLGQQQSMMDKIKGLF